ncbi:MAG: cupin domain-containing protein [Actinomycetota bacterium]
MPKTSKGQAPETFETEGFEGNYDKLEGWTIGFERYTAEADLSDLFKGLPDDACQCSHLGVVLSGRLVFTYRDGTEDVIAAGEAYVTKAGHTPKIYPGTEVIEFSPTEAFDRTMEVVGKNMEAMA